MVEELFDRLQANTYVTIGAMHGELFGEDREIRPRPDLSEKVLEVPLWKGEFGEVPRIRPLGPLANSNRFLRGFVADQIRNRVLPSQSPASLPTGAGNSTRERIALAVPAVSSQTHAHASSPAGD